MAGEDANAEGAFRPSAMNRIASADELDHYIKVTNPSAWVVVCAALLLAVGVIVWAVVAIVPVTVSTTGVLLPDAENGDVVAMCWVDEQTADRITASGAQATINGAEAHVKTANRTPMSASEVISFLGSDFYADSIDLSDWNYPVTIVPDSKLDDPDYSIETARGEAGLVQVSMVVMETRPINILLGNK